MCVSESNDDYDGQRGRRWQLRVAGLLLLGASTASVAQEAADDVPFTLLEDTFIVRAERATETDQGNGMAFEGGIVLHASDWRIEADSAVLAGQLDDPERVVVDGSPARIVVGATREAEPLEGRGQHLEFEPRTQTLRLEGEATIVKGDQSISSESIKYLIDEGKFAAGSHGRVKVVTRRR